MARKCPGCKCQMTVRIANGIQNDVCWSCDIWIKKEEEMERIGVKLCPNCGGVMHEDCGEDSLDYYVCGVCGHKQRILNGHGKNGDLYLGMGHA